MHNNGFVALQMLHCRHCMVTGQHGQHTMVKKNGHHPKNNIHELEYGQSMGFSMTPGMRAGRVTPSPRPHVDDDCPVVPPVAGGG